MTHEKKFPINLTDGFPVNIAPVCPHVQKVSGDHCATECLGCNENVCECSSVLESSEEEENDLYKKGGPFYKMTKKETTPTMAFLETFSKADFCDFNKEKILENISSNFWNEEANELCFQLIKEAHDYAIKNHFNIKQCLALMEMFYSMFKYFMTFPILTKRDFYKYFRELLLLYCVQDAPDSLRLFNPMEGFAIAYKFSTLFDRNYDLLRATLFSDWEVHVNIKNLNSNS